MKGVAAKPFLKWAGGKTQVLDEIRARYPEGLGRSINKYAEPFIGGGAVLFDILGRYEFDSVYISDVNRQLILTYATLRDDVEELICALGGLESNYISSDEGGREEIYYSLRDKYNELAEAGGGSVELAALFIFLNRTCFNGLYRVNSRGGFNVPQGRYKNPRILDERNLRAVSARLQNVGTIVCGDYSLSAEFIDENTFVYFDPPYRPLSATASFTSYSNGGFGDDGQTALAEFFDRMSARGPPAAEQLGS